MGLIANQAALQLLIQVKKQDKFSYYYANLGILMQYINTTKKYSVI